MSEEGLGESGLTSGEEGDSGLPPRSGLAGEPPEGEQP